MSRLAHKQEVIRRLFALSGNKCAFPGCPDALITDRGEFTGQVCHIEAANKGGERYNEAQTDEERRSFGNLVLFCYKHHQLTNNVSEYPVSRLKEIKDSHEKMFLTEAYEIPENSLNNILSQVDGKLNDLLDLSQDTNDKAAEMLRRQEEMFGLFKSTLAKPAFDEEKIYISQLDSIKELKKKYKYRTVIELLLDYKNKNWPHLTPELKYRVIVNLGMTWFDLQDRQSAAEVFFELEGISYETEDSIAFLALASALTGNDDKFTGYFTKGKSNYPHNTNLWLAFIYRYRDEKSLEDLLAEIPLQVQDTAEVLFNLGEIAYKEGNAKDGAAFLERAQSLLPPTDGKIADAKAVIAARLLLVLVTPFKFVYGHFSQQEKEFIEDAKLLLTEAWDLIKDTELAETRWFIVMNRGIAYKVTGDFDKALRDLEKAYEVSGQYLAFKNLVLLYIQLKKYGLAEELLSKTSADKNLSEQRCFEIASIKAKLAIQQGNVQEGIALLTVWLDESSEERYFHVLMLIIHACLENGLIESGQAWCGCLLKSFPAHIDSYLYSGYLFYKIGQLDKALENYDHAGSLINGAVPPETILFLANNYFDIGKHEKAAALFEKIADNTIFNEISKRLTYAYYQCGNLTAALALASTIFLNQPREPFLAEIIIGVYFETGNYEKAIEALEPFLAVVHPDFKDAFLLKRANLFYRTRNMEEVKASVLAMQNPEKLQMQDCYTIAYFLVKSGEFFKGLDLAYNTRAKYYADSGAHAAYINILHHADKEYAPFMFPGKVGEGCAVYLKPETGEEEIFFITREMAAGDHVILPSNPLAVQLMGKSVNDKVIIEKGFGIRRKFLIAAVLDKYVYAVRESVKLFETRFVGLNGFMTLKANPGDTADETLPFIKSISLQRQWFKKNMLDLYVRHSLPLGVMAAMLHQSTIKQWFGMLSETDVFLPCHSCNEYPAVERAVDTLSAVVLDITSLLSNFFLFPEQILMSAIENTFIVASSVIDELQEFYDELETYVTDGRLSLSYQDGELVSDFVDKENILRQRQVIETIIVWCKGKVLIKWPSQKLTLQREVRKKASGLLGETFHDTILLAKEYNAPVLSDDDNFKKLLAADGIARFSTYQLSVYLLNKNIISKRIFENISYQLMLANHIYIPVDTDLLWKVFDAAGYQIRKPFTVAVKGLLILQPNEAVNIFVCFIKKVFLTINIVSSREQLILFILAELSHHPQFSEIKKNTLGQIEKEFYLLQNFRDEFLSLINSF